MTDDSMETKRARAADRGNGGDGRMQLVQLAERGLDGCDYEDERGEDVYI